MSVEIPPAFVAYVEERGGEVHVEDYPAWQDETDWHPAGQQIWIRKTEMVGDRAYTQALTINEAVFRYPDRWELLFDLLEAGLQNSIRRGQAWLS
jgi:hypothetical protein